MDVHIISNLFMPFDTIFWDVILEWYGLGLLGKFYLCKNKLQTPNKNPSLLYLFNRIKTFSVPWNSIVLLFLSHTTVFQIQITFLWRNIVLETVVCPLFIGILNNLKNLAILHIEADPNSTRFLVDKVEPENAICG